MVLPDADVASAREAAAAGRSEGKHILERVINESIRKSPEGKRAKFKKPKKGTAPGFIPTERQLATLAAYGPSVGFQKGRVGNGRRCSATTRRTGLPCRMPAVVGSARCHFHGGRGAKERALQHKYADYKPDMAAVGRMVLDTIVYNPKFPTELLRDVPELAECLRRARKGVQYNDPLFEGWTPGERALHHEACVVLILRWFAAWDMVRDHGNFSEWSECARMAASMGLHVRA